MVRGRGGLQRHGDGAAGAEPGGPLQLLLQEIQPQNRPAACRPNGKDCFLTLGTHLPSDGISRSLVLFSPLLRLLIHRGNGNVLSLSLEALVAQLSGLEVTLGTSIARFHSVGPSVSQEHACDS